MANPNLSGVDFLCGAGVELAQVPPAAHKPSQLPYLHLALAARGHTVKRSFRLIPATFGLIT